MKLKIHTDGGSRGNPGPAGAGVAITDERGRRIFEAGFFLGRMTNNMAEYHGLLRGLDYAERARASEVLIVSDSELLVRQLNGEYRVKNANLKDLFDEAMAALRRIGKWKVQHVRRDSNHRADELANLAMDAAHDVIEFDGRGDPQPDRAQINHGPHIGAGSTADRRATRVTARCIRGSMDSGCPAPCRPGDAIVFEKTVPAGICLTIAPVLLAAVQKAQASPEECNASCPRPTCGAAYVVVQV